MKEKKACLFLADSWHTLLKALGSEIEKEKEVEPLQPVVVLVGSGLLAQHLEREIYPRLNQKGLGLNVRFLIFPELVDTLYYTSPVPEFKPGAGNFLKRIFCKNLLKELGPGHHFYELKETQGLLESVLNEHRDLKDGLILSAELEGLKKSLRGRSNSKALLDLFQIFEALDQRLKSYEEDWERFNYAKARADRFEKVFQTRTLFLYGFYDFTAVQKQLVKSLSRFVELVAFMVKPEKEEKGDFWFFEYAERVFNFYQTELGLAPRVLSTDFAETNLGGVKKALSRKEKVRPGLDQSLTVIFSAGIDQEVVEVCREIIRLVKEEGLRFEEIGILIRDYASYARALEEALKFYQIPYFLAEGKPLSGFSTIRGLMRLLRLPQEHYSRRAMITFLTSHCLKRDLNLGSEAQLMGLFDLVSREAGIVKGKEDWEPRLTKYLTNLQTSLNQARFFKEPEDEVRVEKQKGLMEKEIQAVKKLLALTKELISNLEELRSQQKWSSMVEKAEGLAEKYLDFDFDQEPELKARLWGVFQEISELDQSGVSGDYQTFLELVEQGVNEEVIRRGKFRQGSVFISELMKARGINFKAVILPGLCEGSFPLQLSEKPLLSDEDREWINQFFQAEGKISFLAERWRQAQEERLLFYLACQQAEEFLVLSCPWLELETNQEKPVSYLLYYALEQMLKEPVELERVYQLGEKYPWVRRLGLSDFFAQKPERALNPKDWELMRLDGLGLKEKAHLLKDPRIVRVCELAQERWFGSDLGIFTGFLGRDKFYQENFSRVLPSSYSSNRLRSYFTCPFQYWVERVLEVRELEEPTPRWGFEKYEQGILFHRILEKLFSLLKKPSEIKDEAKFLQTLKEVSSQEGKKYLTEEVLCSELIAQLELSEAEAFLRGWRRALLPEPGIERWETEVKIERGKAKLKLEDGEEVELIGTVDRLAYGKGVLEVTDYKFGRVENLRKDPLQQFQVPIYLLSVLNFYQGVSPEKVKSRFLVLNPEGLQKPVSLGASGMLMEEIRRILGRWIKEMRAGIRNGFFVPVPRDKGEHSSCSRCSYASLCFSSRGEFEQKSKNEMVEQYRGFLEKKEENRFRLEEYEAE